MDQQYTLPKALKEITNLRVKLSKAHAENERLRYKLLEQDKRIKVLEARVAELEIINKKQMELINELSRRLGLDSSNSNFPPSSDMFGKKKRNPQNNRDDSNNNPGGQPGHKGSNLKFVECSNEEIDYKPTECSSCGELALSQGKRILN